VERLSLPNESGRPFVRIFNAFRLGSALIWKVIRNRYDVIMISTAPPVLVGSRFIYHCMDIHPEVGKVSGEFSHPLLFKLLSKVDSWSCRQAGPVVVLSRDMEKTLRGRDFGDELSIRVFNNFSLPTQDVISDNLPFEWHQECFTVLFAGNIGRFQGLDIVVEAMGKLKGRKDIEFVLMGEGVAKKSLQQKAKELGASIRFIGHQPVEVAKAAMRRADAGFVSLVGEVYKYAYPSKTMAYLEQGCPLIVAVEPESELALDVVAGAYGHTILPGDSQGLADLLVVLAEDRHAKMKMRYAATRKYEKDFSEDIMLQKWSLLLQENEIIVS
jgi:glycosyltransferase involved in cell wall biosynthesis